MLHPGPTALALMAFFLAAACPLPAVAQVWEPGDPPRERYGLPAEMQEVPDVPPDTETTKAGPPKTEPAQSAPLTPAPAAPAARAAPVPVSPARARAESAPATPAPAAAPEPAGTPRTANADPDDFLCTRAPAGKAVAVPAPFDRWLVRVCSPRGQALMPAPGEAWVVHNSADPVSILAMPPGAVPPPTAGAFDARYDIRFVSLAGGKTAGEREDRAAALLQSATGQGTLPAHDAIWQLDAVSNVGETRYNLFFYIAGERPARIIACLDQCRQALYLDVLKGEEAKEVLAR
ncbi:hypothetical protein [Parvibaculum sp.]|uniref:hypothetical protein n=1 Tax=Parvibaculum sp. TaxID=2024848 RepID=UPI003298F498